MEIIREFRNPNDENRVYIEYICPSCGKEKSTRKWRFLTKKNHLCVSCLMRTEKTKHGLANDPLYIIWAAIKQRCTNKNNKSYQGYGGRGISISTKWVDNPEKFTKWALKNGYKKGLQIDRINNDGDYEPSNCRWVTCAIQAQNTRRLRKNNTSGYRGVSAGGKNWQAQIHSNGKSIYIGIFNTKIEAAKAYDNYVTEHNTEHPLNFKEEK